MVSGQRFLLDILTIRIEYQNFPLKVKQQRCPKIQSITEFFANSDYFKTLISCFVKTCKLWVSPFVNKFHADKEYMVYVLHFELSLYLKLHYKGL